MASAQMTASRAPAAPKRVAGRSLGGAAGRAGTEYRCDGEVLGAVIARCRGTVQVDVIDIAGGKVCGLQRLLDRRPCATAFGVRARHM